MSQWPNCLYCSNPVTRDGRICCDCLEEGILPASSLPVHEDIRLCIRGDVSHPFVETEHSLRMYHGQSVRDDI